jgi:hypothetical protein
MFKIGDKMDYHFCDVRANVRAKAKVAVGGKVQRGTD